MENSQFFKKYIAFLSFRPDRYGKTTLFENQQILVGLNCLNPGQMMEKHAHADQTRFYLVVEGKGTFWIGDEKQVTEGGTVVWVPAGYPHRIENTGDEPLALLVGITPGREKDAKEPAPVVS